MTELPKTVSSGQGYHEHPLGHSLNAKGIGGYKPVSAVEDGMRRPLTKEERTELESRMIPPEEFRKIAASWKEGQPIPNSTELFIPNKRVWLEGRERAGKGESIKYEFAVRPEVFRKAAYKSGGVIRHIQEYKPMTEREKKMKRGANPERAAILKERRRLVSIYG